MSALEQQNKKRIAKNTLLLYFRMLFLMVISLYTSRVVLNILGVENFGIYNVVGGVVAMLSMLTGSLSAAISRFITFELGNQNFKRLNTVFSTAVSIQVLLALIIIVVAEVFGFWFLNAKMNIPAERMYAANWVLQYSILTFAINLISIPYNAAIIAHEKMSAFAYVSILEGVLKLIIAYLLYLSSFDKLIAYACLLCAVALTIRVIYGIYCKRYFEECTWHWVFDKSLLKQMLGFSGWNFIGVSASVFRDQGVNIALNLFCGPVVNAARGIAVQVNIAINNFAQNFMTALNPQITKSYALGNRVYMMRLIFQGARLSFYMLLLLSLPVLVNTQYILTLWLNTVPDYTVVFVQLMLILTLCESLSYPLITAMLATGNIKKYQIIVGGLNMMNFPISYVLLWVGCSPEITLIVAIIIAIGCLVVRLWLLRGMIGLSFIDYSKKVVFNVVSVSIVSVSLSFCVKPFIILNLWSFIVSSLFFVISTVVVIYFIGCTHSERQLVFSFIQKKIKKKGK